MARKTKSPKREKPRERRERRFAPRPTVSPWLAASTGAVGALAMGAGTWEQFGSLVSDASPGPLKIAPYILIGGSVLVAIAIWIGTSGEPLLRVGDAGVALEKNNLRRMPWYSVERIEWRGEAVRVIGKDEFGAATTMIASLATQPQAAAWIVKEARERIPALVDVPTDATLPEAGSNAGEVLVLDPPQVVGRPCAASGTLIAYEPDARVCPRCERVYHAAHVPETCACGGSLARLGGAAAGARAAT
jgi:hypothetical protein